MAHAPIGFFDSGYGGLSILKEVVKEMPQYDYLYLGDNARAPYGNKDFETVYQHTLQAVKWFFSQGSCLVILACNTASAKALRTIQQNDLPSLDPQKRVLGVIRPTAEVIGKYSNSGHVGVLGTIGTIQSQSYLIETEKSYPLLTVSQEACPEWVSLVEKNLMHTPEADALVKYHIDQILEKDPNIDALLLACTHYPLLMETIQKHISPEIKIVAQGPIVAKSLGQYLLNHTEIDTNCTKNGIRDFYTTGETSDFDSHASLFFGEEIVSKSLIL